MKRIQVCFSTPLAVEVYYEMGYNAVLTLHCKGYFDENDNIKDLRSAISDLKHEYILLLPTILQHRYRNNITTSNLINPTEKNKSGIFTELTKALSNHEDVVDVKTRFLTNHCKPIKSLFMHSAWPSGLTLSDCFRDSKKRIEEIKSYESLQKNKKESKQKEEEEKHSAKEEDEDAKDEDHPVKGKDKNLAKQSQTHKLNKSSAQNQTVMPSYLNPNPDLTPSQNPKRGHRRGRRIQNKPYQENMKTPEFPKVLDELEEPLYTDNQVLNYKQSLNEPHIVTNELTTMKKLIYTHNLATEFELKSVEQPSLRYQTKDGLRANRKKSPTGFGVHPKRKNHPPLNDEMDELSTKISEIKLEDFVEPDSQRFDILDEDV